MPEVTERSGLLLVARVLGAALLIAMAGIHLWLWFDGYADIPLVGPGFLVNAVAGVVLAAALLLVPHRAVTTTAALGALLMAGTLGALLLSLTVGLFGFFDALEAPLVPTTLVVESVGLVVLLATALQARRRLSPAAS